MDLQYEDMDREQLLQSLKQLQDTQDEVTLSEAKYRALVEGSSDLIYILDPEGRFTFANPAIARLLGYSPDEVIGKRFESLLDPADVEALGFALKERRIGERATQHLEAQLRTSSGEIRDVELDLRLFSFNASGLYRGKEFVGTHGVARDVTERKFQENKRLALEQVREAVRAMTAPTDIDSVLEAIRQGMERLRLPFAHCSVNILETADPLRLQTYSAPHRGAMRRHDDWPADTGSLYARTVVEIWRGATPAYRLDLEKEDTYRERDQLKALFGPVRSVVDLPFSHGTLSVNTPVADAFSERDLGVLGELAETLTDAFRRRQDLLDLALSERRYRTLVEAPHFIVMLLDPEANFLYVSPQIEQWLGYAPNDFYRDPDLWCQIVHPEDRDQVTAFATVDQDNRIQNAAFRFCRRQGDFRQATASAFPIYETETDETLNRVSMVQVVIQDMED
jgi:PAS domain S-box-containing protein